MRFLLLLLFAAASALAVPYLIHGARPGLFPAETDVSRAFADAQEVGRLLLETWRKSSDPMATTPEPPFSDARMWSMAAVLGVSAVWFEGFMLGGLIGLLLLRVSETTLAVLAVICTFALYSCTEMRVTHDFTPETVSIIRRFAALQLIAAIVGFIVARSSRRVTV